MQADAEGLSALIGGAGSCCSIFWVNGGVLWIFHRAGDVCI